MQTRRSMLQAVIALPCVTCRLQDVNEARTRSVAGQRNTRLIAWNELVRFGPPLPTNRRIVSPTSACNARSPMSAPTAPLNPT